MSLQVVYMSRGCKVAQQLGSPKKALLCSIIPLKSNANKRLGWFVNGA